MIFTKSYSPESEEAKKILRERGVSFEEKVIDTDFEMQKELEIKTGGRSDVPQIFINGSHIGGVDDLRNMADQKDLDTLLNE